MLRGVSTGRVMSTVRDDVMHGNERVPGKRLPPASFSASLPAACEFTHDDALLRTFRFRAACCYAELRWLSRLCSVNGAAQEQKRMLQLLLLACAASSLRLRLRWARLGTARRLAST